MASAPATLFMPTVVVKGVEGWPLHGLRATAGVKSVTGVGASHHQDGYNITTELDDAPWVNPRCSVLFVTFICFFVTAALCLVHRLHLLCLA